MRKKAQENPTTNERMQLLRFQPEMLGRFGRTWNRHISECEECKNWKSKQCRIFGHSKRSKNNILNDISLSKHVPGKIRTSWNGKTCCEMNLCAYEFYEPERYDIPWWACYDKAVGHEKQERTMARSTTDNGKEGTRMPMFPRGMHLQL